MGGWYKRLLILFIVGLTILASTNVFSLDVEESNHIRLLAVHEIGAEYKGSIADLYLEIKPGSGQIFIDTFPLSKIDTQISTRYAREIVCDYLDYDCSNYDFFYTIRSNSVIVGGPSAGAAMAALTYASLEGLDIDETVSVTGTINSGGTIGPVSGLKSKIDVASKYGIKTILIPGGNTFFVDDKDAILDLVDYGNNRGIIIREVYDLDDLMYYFSGLELDERVEFKIPELYTNTMASIAKQICDRSTSLQNQVVDVSQVELSETDKVLRKHLMDAAVEFSSKSESSLDLKNYYSAASYCFTSNINYQNILLISQHLNDKTVVETISHIENKINLYETNLNDLEINTISDLEAYIVLAERLISARDFIDNAKASFYDDYYTSLHNLAYAIERFESVFAWDDFLGLNTVEFKINENVLRESCIKKISEAQERFQYVQLFVPEKLSDAQKLLERSLDDYKNDDYILCISKASKAKANVNVLSNVMGVPVDSVDSLFLTKIESVEKVISKVQDKGGFPILGYSYYEYSKSLSQTDLYKALIYAEEALELSSLDVYFEKENSPSYYLRYFKMNFNLFELILFLVGVSLGVIIITILFYISGVKINRHRRKRKIMRKL